jgi:TonB family protein
MADNGTPELQLLREFREPVSPWRILVAGIGSILFHILALGILTVLPAPETRDAPLLALDVRKAVPLYMPKELTQRDANIGRITRNLDVRSAAPPAPVPQVPRFRPPEPRPVSIPSIPAPAVEEPKIEASAPPPPAAPGGIPQIAPPVEKPKLAFENVGAPGPSPRPNPNPNPNVRLPRTETSPDMTSASVRPSQGSGGIVIGDIDELTTIPSPNRAPSSGPVRSNLQLLSDPKGVDFKPYLIQVLAAVRTNWLAVIPESARMGRRGRVLIQFIVDRNGGVPKLVIAESSGTAALDRAAVAGITASYPFPPLPAAFPSDEVRLQLAFSYNLPPR